MDFFGILYDIKNGKKVPYSKTYFDTLFAAKLEELGVKTITGTLPLTFSTSEDKLRDWTIYGNNSPHNYSTTGTLPLTVTTHTAGEANDWTIYGNAGGVGERTAQLFDGSTIQKGRVDNGVPGYASDTSEATFENGVITFTTTANYRGVYFDLAEINDDFTLYIGALPNDVYCYLDYYASDQSYLTRTTLSSFSSFPYTYSREMPNDAKYVRLSLQKTAAGLATCSSIVLVEGSTAPTSYIPYGYEIPLTISQTGQTDKNYDIYIGDSPLTEGETVSKTSTGVDIELFEGENTISTTLYNKPSMSIEGLDYVGVGEPTNDGWQIPLTVSDGTNTTAVNVPIEAPLTAGETATKTSTGVDIATADGTNTISTTLENKPEMTITYKGG